jgi:hypothetical protein
MEWRDLAIKWPFAMSWEELEVYGFVFAAPWFGGFGPCYGWVTFTLLCLLIPVLVRSRYEASAGAEMLRGWMPLVFSMLFGILLMPSFMPRWVPFLWLVPWAVILQLMDRGDGRFSRPILLRLMPLERFRGSLVSLLAVILLFSSLLLFALNTWGHVRASGLVREQFEVLAQVKVPLRVVFQDFPSNRDWFEAAQLDYVSVGRLPVRSPSLCLVRTNTKVILPRAMLDQPIRVGGVVYANLREWAQSVDRRSGLRERWLAWIAPCLDEGAR